MSFTERLTPAEELYLAADRHFTEKGSSLDRSVWSFAKKRNLRARIIADDHGDPYLLRLYITPHQDDELGKPTAERRLPAVYLHYFFRGDHDRELHNHPWVWALSLILTRGYMEERLRRHGVLRDIVRSRKYAGTVNLIRQNDFHRVLLDKGSCWTLFVAGPRVPAVRGEDWGFLDDEGTYISWGERDKRKQVSP